MRDLSGLKRNLDRLIALFNEFLFFFAGVTFQLAGESICCGVLSSSDIFSQILLWAHF